MNPVAVTGMALVGPRVVGGEALLVSDAHRSDDDEEIKQYLSSRVPKRMLRRMTHLGAMVVGGSIFALEQAGFDRAEARAPVGSVLGTAYGEIAIACRIFEGGLDAGISPTAFHNSVHNASLGYLSIFGGLRGPCMTISDSTLSGEVALAEGACLLVDDTLDAVVVSAGDESCPSVFSPCWRSGEDAPRSSARGSESGQRVETDEGCGFLVLETPDRAGQRAIAHLGMPVHRSSLEAVLDAYKDPDVVVVPAGLHREPDPTIVESVTGSFGNRVRMVCEGERVGYVPASGVIRTVLACDIVAHDDLRVLVLGTDLDGHASGILVTRGRA